MLQVKDRGSGATAYEQWIEMEGIPITRAVAGVEDVLEVPRGPWDRVGGCGAFIQLRSTIEAERGIYVGEIPGGKVLNPEKHLYEEAILILRGRGATEVWQGSGSRAAFEWGEGSFFSPPRNTWHRLINGGQEPVLFLAVTTAPQVFDAFRDLDFIFNCDYQFTNIYNGQADYFTPPQERIQESPFSVVWRTNFIADVRAAFLDDLEQKVAGGQSTDYVMASGFPKGHMSEWPVGRYHKAHCHGSGALVIGLLGEGYVLLWPHEAGIRPYQGGDGDRVVKMDWKPRSIYAPPDGWFHMHFNTGPVPARHIAVHGRGGSYRATNRGDIKGEWFGMMSTRDGGTLIDYEDEDPEIRRQLTEILARKGIKCEMPLVAYR